MGAVLQGNKVVGTKTSRYPKSTKEDANVRRRFVGGTKPASRVKTSRKDKAEGKKRKGRTENGGVAQGILKAQIESVEGLLIGGLRVSHRLQFG